MFYIDLHKPGSFCHTVPFPSSWDELTTEELELVAAEQILTRETPYDNKAVLFTTIIEMRAKSSGITLPRGWVAMLNLDDAATAGFDCMDFFYTGNERTRNPYPKLKVGSFFLNGPEDNFDAISCGEHEDCEVFFHLFQEDTNTEYLARMASIMWRPKTGVPEEDRYVQERSERLFPIFCKLPVTTLLSIYIWYSGCRNQLPKLFPEVYRQNEKTEDGEYERDIAAFTKCIHAGAGAKNGTRDMIRIMKLKEFLFDMNLEALEVRRIKDKQ